MYRLPSELWWLVGCSGHITGPVASMPRGCITATGGADTDAHITVRAGSSSSDVQFSPLQTNYQMVHKWYDLSIIHYIYYDGMMQVNAFNIICITLAMM